jgi:mannose-6-phosphate isomerase-like protein (cupin superfamily)
MSADYTKVNFETDVEDMAPHGGLSPQVEARFAREPLGLQNSGVSRMRVQGGFRTPFGHKHGEQEEVYVVVSGSARLKLDDEVLDLGQWDAVRIAPGVMRCLEAGPDGCELVLVGAPAPRDTEMVANWWTD